MNRTIFVWFGFYQGPQLKSSGHFEELVGAAKELGVQDHGWVGEEMHCQSNSHESRLSQ